MRVFISSVISGFERFREAASAAIRTLGYEVIRAEDFPASTKSPQIACLSGVREADLVVLIMGERYGAFQPSGKSPTHEEYDEAKNTKPLLVFVQRDVAMEPDQAAFREEVERWQTGYARKDFATPDELRERVTEAIHKHSMALARGRVDEAELGRRAQELIPRNSRGNEAVLVLAVAYGPKQPLLRPKQLDDALFRKKLHQAARFGENAILDELAKTGLRVDGNALLIEQQNRLVRLDETGSIVIEQPARSGEDHHGLGWLIKEDLEERAEKALRFADDVLGTVDPTERLTHGCVVAGLLGAAHVGWKTREEYRRHPNSGTMGMADDRIVAELRPAALSREQLRHDVKSIAEDLVHLLRREHSPQRGRG